MGYLIEMRETARRARSVWADRVSCTKKEAVRTAEDLLVHLRETDPRAMVWIDGRRVRLPKTKGNDNGKQTLPQDRGGEEESRGGRQEIASAGDFLPGLL